MTLPPPGVRSPGPGTSPLLTQPPASLVHVTCPVLHVTCYMSRVTCYMSRVTYVTCHVSSYPPMDKPGVSPHSLAGLQVRQHGLKVVKLQRHIVYCCIVHCMITFMYSSSTSASMVEGLANSVSQIFLPYLSNNGS